MRANAAQMRVEAAEMNDAARIAALLGRAAALEEEADRLGCPSDQAGDGSVGRPTGR